MPEPIAVLLTGIVCCGKTTLARALTELGLVRLSVGGQARHKPAEHAVPALNALGGRLLARLADGRNVVVDHGLLRRSHRDQWRALVETAGARAVVVYLPVTKAEVVTRLAVRHHHGNHALVDPDTIDTHLARFEPPQPGERILVYNGDPDSVLA